MKIEAFHYQAQPCWWFLWLVLGILLAGFAMGLRLGKKGIVLSGIAGAWAIFVSWSMIRSYRQPDEITIDDRLLTGSANFKSFFFRADDIESIIVRKSSKGGASIDVLLRSSGLYVRIPAVNGPEKETYKALLRAACPGKCNLDW